MRLLCYTKILLSIHIQLTAAQLIFYPGSFKGKVGEDLLFENIDTNFFLTHLASDLIDKLFLYTTFLTVHLYILTILDLFP